ncbi:MAG: fimbrillin family protein [Rikenellaceae bacterium]
MKKITLFAMAMAVALSSCSKNEVMDTPIYLQDAIGFSTYLGTTTKAELVSDSSVSGTKADFISYKVNAYSTLSDFGNLTSSDALVTYISDETVMDSDGSNDSYNWASANTYYWPSSNLLSFFAYSSDLGASGVSADYTAPSYNSGLTYPKLTFTATSGTEDLVVATSYNQTTANSNTDANLKFTHALTKINVEFLPTFDTGVTDCLNYSFTVNSLKVNAYTMGTYTYAANADAAVASWEGTDGKQELSFVVPASAFAGSTTTAVAATVGDCTGFMLIPGTEATFTVEYTVTYKNVLIATHEKTVPNVTLGAIAANTRYTLYLPVDATEIIFKATSLTEWAAENTGLISGTVTEASEYAYTCDTGTTTAAAFATEFATTIITAFDAVAANRLDDDSQALEFTVSATNVTLSDSTDITIGNTTNLNAGDTIVITFNSATDNCLNITDNDNNANYTVTTDTSGNTVTITVAEQV